MGIIADASRIVVQPHAYTLSDNMRAQTNFSARLAKLSWAPLVDFVPGARAFSAYAEVIAGATQERGKPDFSIQQVIVGDEFVPVSCKKIANKDFCDLVEFSCDSNIKKPRILLFAPLSGHYASLLAKTVQGYLPNYDVVITDWKNARDVPLSAGAFGVSDYVDYCIDFIDIVKPDALMAVCQPCPELAAAIAFREKNGMKNPPVAVFKAGPIDTRKAPTAVTKLAAEKPLSWFEENMLWRVPAGYAGAGRKVYPGFLQLVSFIGLKPEEHKKKFQDLTTNIINGDKAAIDKHNLFYDEYLSVLDLPAQFYLETVDLIFQKQALANGQWVHRDQIIDLGAITKTAIMVVEGDRDDISAPGQTLALLDLCSNLSPTMKFNKLVAGVGHYGVFNGTKFEEQVVPAVTSFIDQFLNRDTLPPVPQTAPLILAA